MSSSRPVLTENGRLVADVLMLLFAAGVFTWALAEWIAG
jgi:hypothetical protein